MHTLIRTTHSGIEPHLSSLRRAVAPLSPPAIASSSSSEVTVTNTLIDDAKQLKNSLK